MRKVFISYHHQNDQFYKEKLLEINDSCRQLYGNPIFIDKSVDTGDISEDLSDENIRQKIRDEYLQDSTVTILLVGTETRYRKHIDWEIYSSMYDGKVNKKSGILVVNLPETANYYCITAGHGEQSIYPEIPYWTSFKTRKEYEDNYPNMPERIIDNLIHPGAKISVINWDKIITDPSKLEYLIDITFKDRVNCDYDLSRPMRRQNYNQFKHHDIFSPFSPNL